jgi:hypothetical protein
MTTTPMDEPYAAALRGLLVEQVQGPGSPSRGSSRSRRWLARAGVVLVLAAGGGGIAYATGAWTTPPGGNRITDLSSPVTATGTGRQTVDLGTPPRGATAINISFTCLTAGTFTFADGASVQCDSADLRRRSPPVVTYTMPIARGRNGTTITATPHARWRLIATYASVATTAWGVNANGQSYGVQNQRGIPDLIAVMATNHRTGYVYADQLNTSPPKTPSEAIAQNNPPPRTLTVYESDGKTPIGKFVVGG